MRETYSFGTQRHLDRLSVGGKAGNTCKLPELWKPWLKRQWNVVFRALVSFLRDGVDALSSADIAVAPVGELGLGVRHDEILQGVAGGRRESNVLMSGKENTTEGERERREAKRREEERKSKHTTLSLSFVTDHKQEPGSMFVV